MVPASDQLGSVVAVTVDSVRIINTGRHMVQGVAVVAQLDMAMQVATVATVDLPLVQDSMKRHLGQHHSHSVALEVVVLAELRNTVDRCIILKVVLVVVLVY